VVFGIVFFLVLTSFDGFILGELRGEGKATFSSDSTF
jgi:hypothetical protein